jgi:hypothetical protein
MVCDANEIELSSRCSCAQMHSNNDKASKDHPNLGSFIDRTGIRHHTDPVGRSRRISRHRCPIRLRLLGFHGWLYPSHRLPQPVRAIPELGSRLFHGFDGDWDCLVGSVTFAEKTTASANGNHMNLDSRSTLAAGSGGSSALSVATNLQ